MGKLYKLVGRRGGALFVMLLLAGCTAPRSISLPPEVSREAIRARVVPPESPSSPQELIPPPREVTPAHHSTRMTEPDVQVFSLPEAIAYGLENNPRLRVLRESVARAEGEELTAFAPFLPEVEFANRLVGFASEVQPTSVAVPAVVGFGSGTPYFNQSELRLQWTLWDFGRTAGRHGQAITRTEIAALRLDRAKQTVAFEVAQAYLRVLFARASRLVQEQSVVRAEAILKDTRARRQGGVADRDDVLRAEVQLSETQEARVSVQQAELDALARLSVALGRNISRPLEVVDVTEQPRFDMSLAECLQIAVDQRREIEIARKAVATAAYGLEAVRADYRPRVYVLGVVSRIDGKGVLNEFVEGAGIHFDQQLYAGGRRQGNQRAAEADVRGAAANAQVICDNIALEVNLAYREIAVARQRIELAQTSVTQARENLRLVRVKYRNGNATPTDIVDAETTLTRSQQRFYSATYEYLIALARLDYALGQPQGTLLQPSVQKDDAFPDELPVPRRLPRLD